MSLPKSAFKRIAFLGAVVISGATAGLSLQPAALSASGCEFDRCLLGQCESDNPQPQNCDMRPGNVGCDVTDCGVQ